MSRYSMRIDGIVLVASLAVAMGPACDSEAQCNRPDCGAPICTTPCNRFESFGGCEEKTTPCCRDQDCPLGTCQVSTGYCLEYLTCGCYDDDSCPAGYVCESNYRACGFCILPHPPTPCTEDSDCEPGYYCKDQTYCQERCCE